MSKYLKICAIGTTKKFCSCHKIIANHAIPQKHEPIIKNTCFSTKYLIVA